MMTNWYYFGCVDSLGHYLFNKNKQTQNVRELEILDGELCLQSRTPYIAVLTRLPNLNYSALAWWDNTVDKRPGSNSIIFAPSLTCSLESIRTGMTKWFPWVEDRLPRPLVVVDEERIYNGRIKH